MLHLKKYIVNKLNKVDVYNNQRYTLRKNLERFLSYIIKPNMTAPRTM